MKSLVKVALATAITLGAGRWLNVPALLLAIVVFFSLRRREWWRPDEHP